MHTRLIPHDDVVQALPPNRSDQPLGVRILPRRLRRGRDFPNPKPSCRFLKFLSIDTVAVAKQIAGRTVPREGFQELPGRPFRRGTCSYCKMDWTTTFVAENHKNKQN